MGDDPKSISEEIIKQVDARTDSPEIRARKVMGILAESKLDYWTLAWFCVTYLTGLALTLPYLKEPIMDIGRLMFNNHYLFPENLGIFDKDMGGKDNDIQQEQESSKSN